jgi:6-phosphofructokinase 1
VIRNGHPLKRLAILVGGGPAPGINGVISAVTIEAINQGIEVFGIRDGNNWIMRGVDELIRHSGGDPEKSKDLYAWVKAGQCKHVEPLQLKDVLRLPFKGGSYLGTSRANPTKDPAHMLNVLDFYHRLGIDAVVSIGGDDTAYSASQVYKNAGGSIRVAHVPKTIDNDLPLPGATPTFGFDTARFVGTGLVRNLAEDSRTTSRWYLVVSMGRAAGHLALGIGKAAAATLTIIPEEFRNKKLTLDHLCDIIIGSIIKRLALDRRHGVAVLAEGLIEALDEQELLKTIEKANGAYGIVERDPFGNLRMGEIEFGRMMRELLTERLKPFKIKTTFIDKELGYELRCADPTPFDCEYVRDLGYGAVKFLLSHNAEKFGAVISFVQGSMNPLPFDTMLSPVTHRMQTRPVDVAGEGYECARRYMTRLEKVDFDVVENLAKLAKVAQMTPDAFRQRFGYLAE